jgi:hypothetical protein
MAAGLVGGLARLPSDSAQLAEGLALEVHQLDRLSEHLAEGGDGCLELLGGSVLLPTVRPCLADDPRRTPGGDGGEEEADGRDHGAGHGRHGHRRRGERKDSAWSMSPTTPSRIQTCRGASWPPRLAADEPSGARSSLHTERSAPQARQAQCANPLTGQRVSGYLPN